MSLKRLPRVLAFIACVAAAFWLYGAGRTIAETVGISWRGTVSGALLSFAVPSAVVSFMPLVRRERWLMTALTLALVLGSVLSELWILNDEHRFTSEVAAAGEIRSRPRTWPNGTASLVYLPGKGVHATD
jgi:integral membrane sensor domain MASE1